MPTGKLRVVAEFAPEAAFGRIRPGQPARMRLDGFPWLQFGTISATVDSVAGETRAGRVRVELEVLADPTSAIPLQHGLPGTVEIEVERVLPAKLALRIAGKIATSALPSAKPDATSPEVSRSEPQ
jgi:membrane fusion protein (multidrug efflux system)